MVPFSYLLLDLVNKFLAIISAQKKKINTFRTIENAIFRKNMAIYDAFICSRLTAWILTDTKPLRISQSCITCAYYQTRVSFLQKHTSHTSQHSIKVETDNFKNTGIIKNTRFKPENLNTLYRWVCIIIMKNVLSYQLCDHILWKTLIFLMKK